MLKRGLLCLLACLCLVMPVFASGPDIAGESISASAVSDGAVPTLSAQSAVLADGEGNVLYAHNDDAILPMASTTKIMTGYVALLYCNDLDAPCKIPKEAVGVEGSSVYLRAGERLTMRDLLYATLMESANDAAAAVAFLTAGTLEDFATLMNEQAEKMGLLHTHFVTPHGLDAEGHHTTAKDLARLTAAALKNPDFREIVSTYKKEIPLHETEGVRLLVNHNRLLKSYEGCIGVKTGYTKKSGRCLVSAAERDGLTLIAVTLNAPDDWNDHKAMFDFGFANYESVPLTQIGEQYAVLPVVGGESSGKDGGATVGVKNTEGAYVTLKKGTYEIHKETYLPRFLYAPVTKGQEIGYVKYYMGDTLLIKIPLYTCEAVALYEKPSLWQRILSFFGLS